MSVLRHVSKACCCLVGNWNVNHVDRVSWHCCMVSWTEPWWFGLYPGGSASACWIDRLRAVGGRKSARVLRR